MQAWIAGSHSTRNPYRLFAVSNLASLAALLAYPWLIEPWLSTAAQAVAWSAAYAAYAMLLRAISLLRPAASSSPSGAIAHADVTRTASRQGGAPGWRRTLAWFALAALGSYQLLAVTT